MLGKAESLGLLDTHTHTHISEAPRLLSSFICRRAVLLHRVIKWVGDGRRLHPTHPALSIQK